MIAGSVVVMAPVRRLYRADGGTSRASFRRRWLTAPQEGNEITTIETPNAALHPIEGPPATHQ